MPAPDRETPLHGTSLRPECRLCPKEGIMSSLV